MITKVKRLLVAALVFAWPATGWAQEEGLLAGVEEIRQEYENTQRAWIADYRKAETEEEKREVLQRRPDPSEVAGKVMDVLKGHREDPAVLEHLGWVLGMTRGQLPEGVMEVLEAHKGAKQVSAVLPYLGYQGPGTKGWEFLTAVRKESPHREAQAMAAFVIANARDVSEEEKVKELKFARDHAGELEFRGRKVAQAADGMLFAAENLVIGKVAPEIEGEDQDGETFKLTDYRGKVVVLDFWGDW